MITVTWKVVRKVICLAHSNSSSIHKCLFLPLYLRKSFTTSESSYCGKINSGELIPYLTPEWQKN